MLDLTARNTTPDDAVRINPYYDLDINDLSKEIYGVEVLDQSIEMVLSTMPGERLFNTSFFSPAYQILFENYTPGIEDKIYDSIEYWVPVIISRSEAKIEFDSAKHTLYIDIPYISNDGSIISSFTRRFRK